MDEFSLVNHAWLAKFAKLSPTKLSRYTIIDDKSLYCIGVYRVYDAIKFCCELVKYFIHLPLDDKKHHWYIKRDSQKLECECYNCRSFSWKLNAMKKFNKNRPCFWWQALFILVMGVDCGAILTCYILNLYISFNLG